MAVPDFPSLQRCFACGQDRMVNVGQFSYLTEQAGFVPDEWLWWYLRPASLVRCRRCHSQGPRSRPGAELLADWYKRQSYAAADLVSEGHRLAAARVKALRPATLVDVGCGPGTFFDLLGTDVNAFGIEPSLASADFGRRRGRRIFEPGEDGWSAELPERVDVITLFDVLEHLPDPRTFLAALLRRLKPGGRLMIFTGNAESRWACRWNVRWWYHGYAGHLSCFSATGLRHLLKELNVQQERLDELPYMLPQRPFRAAVRSLPLRVACRIGALRLLDSVRVPQASSPLGSDHMLMTGRLGS